MKWVLWHYYSQEIDYMVDNMREKTYFYPMDYEPALRGDNWMLLANRP